MLRETGSGKRDVLARIQEIPVQVRQGCVEGLGVERGEGIGIVIKIQISAESKILQQK